jgi:hypothetical protein
MTPETKLVTTFLKLLRRDGHYKLIFRADRRYKELCVSDGTILYASSNSLKDKLSEIFFKAGKLTKEQYMLSTELSIFTKKRMGEILINEGILPMEEVVRGLRFQAKKILSGIFEHPLWKVKILSPLKEEPPSITPGVAFVDAVMTGIRSIDNLTVLCEAMPSMETVPTFVPEGDDLQEQICFNRDESLLLHLINGQRTLRDIFEASRMWEYRFYKTIYPLMALPILKCHLKPRPIPVPVSPSEDTTCPETPEPDLGQAPSSAEDEDFPSDTLFDEAKFLLSMERYSEAANRLKKLIQHDGKKSAYYYYLGLALDHIPGQNKEAEKVLKMAIHLENYNGRYYLALGYLYLNRDLKRQAREQFVEALKWEPNDPYVQEALKRLDKLEKKSGFLPTKLFQ